MLDHEKWRRAIRQGGDGVLLMWWRLASWCSRRLTDGRVPADMVDELAQLDGSKTRAKALQALVDASLLAWHGPVEDSTELRRGLVEPAPRSRRDGDELVVVGYLARNPSKAKVLQELERKAKAQRDYEDRKRLTASVTNQGPIRVRPDRSDPENVPPRPAPSRIDPQEERESAREVGDATSLHREAVGPPDNASPTPRVKFRTDWKPTKDAREYGRSLGLTDDEMRERAEHCRLKLYTHAFSTEDEQYRRELLWLRNDKETQRFKEQRKANPHGLDENPGTSRRSDDPRPKPVFGRTGPG